MGSNKISGLSGDNMVVDAAAARDRVADNGLICAYMELRPSYEKYGVWSMYKDGVLFETCFPKTSGDCVVGFCDLAKYDTSWEWIMPVVERIRLEKWNTHQVYFIMHNDFVEVKAGSKKELGGMGFGFKVRGSGISSVYEAVVKYLEL